MSTPSKDLDLRIKYRVLRRPIKYARLELRGSELWIIIPKDADLSKVIKENKKWIIKQSRIVEEAQKLASTLEIVPRTRRKFRALVERLVSEYADLLKVKVNKIFIRKMKNSWASCSSAGNISVSREARYLPEKLIRYIIYHEVCHLVRWRHDQKFHELISKLFPDYERLDLQLHAYWIKLNAMNAPRSAQPPS